MNHKAKLLRKVTVADGTMAFYFEKPLDYEYLAGQHAYFSLPKQSFFSKQLQRIFSFITIPEDEELGFATRMREESDFKPKLKVLESGAYMEISYPEGEFILPHENGVPLVFLAGGIGITPFYSMIKHATITNAELHITLFYSNRNRESTAFLQDLQDFQRVNDHFNLVATMTDPEVQNWNGERGYITPEMIKKHCPDWEISTFYIAGPFEMVKAMKEVLGQMGVPSAQIRLETFVGY